MENKKHTDLAVKRARQLDKGEGGIFEQSLFKTMQVANLKNLKVLKDAFPVFGEVFDAWNAGV